MGPGVKCQHMGAQRPGWGPHCLRRYQARAGPKAGREFKWAPSESIDSKPLAMIILLKNWDLVLNLMNTWLKRRIYRVGNLESYSFKVEIGKQNSFILVLLAEEEEIKLTK